MKNSFKTVKLIIQKYPSYIIFGFIMAIFNASLPLLNIFSIKLIIEILESKSDDMYIRILNVSLLFIIIYSILSIINSYYYKRFCPIKEQKIKTTFKKEFFIKISKTNLINFEDSSFYNNLAKASDVVEKNLISTCDHFFNFITSIVEVLVLSTVVIIFNYKLIFICVFFIIINFILTYIISKTEYFQYDKNVINTRKQGYISSLFTNKKYSEEIKIHKFSPFLIRRYEKNTEDKINVIKKVSWKSTVVFSIQKIMQLSFSIILIIILSVDVIAGVITLGIFSSMLIASQNFVTSFSSLFYIIPNLKKSSLYIDNYYNFIEAKDNVNGDIDFDYQKIKINTNNLTFHYPDDDKNVLNNVSISIEDNSKIGIVGHNGAGKTTLIKLLIGEYFPQSGSILYNYENLENINRDLLLDHVAIIPQNFNMYEYSIAENLLMREYNKEEDESVLIDVLKKLGLFEKVNSLKDQEYTILGKMFEVNGTDFSGGEKQKIAIARALVRDPDIIIMDEPTASLDPIAEKEIIDLSINLFKNKKMIIISHRLSMTLKTDYIYFMEKGQVVEEGSHEALMNKKGKYYETFMTTASNYIG